MCLVEFGCPRSIHVPSLNFPCHHQGISPATEYHPFASDVLIDGSPSNMVLYSWDSYRRSVHCQVPMTCPLHPVAKRQRWHWPGWSPPWHQSPSWRAESPWTQRTKPPEHSNFRDLSPAPVRPVNYKKLSPRCPKMSQIHLKSWVQTSRQARNQRFSPETVRLPGSRVEVAEFANGKPRAWAVPPIPPGRFAAG